MNSTIARRLISLIALLLLSYMGCQICKNQLFKYAQKQRCLRHYQIRQAENLDRKETLLTHSGNGIITWDRMSKGGVVASVYSSAELLRQIPSS